MIKKYWQYAVTASVLLLGITAMGGLLFINSCGDTGKKDLSVQSSSATIGPAGAPKNALFGQYYKDPATGKLWIYDGANWVPRDSNVDAYYAQLNAAQLQLKATSGKVQIAMTQDEVRTAPCTSADATGAHAKHYGFDCKVCHMVGGVMCFDPNGPAYNASFGAPAFDATAKTCTNVACHTVAPGTFSYYYPGDETDADGYPIPVLKTVNYGGGAPRPTPSWYTTPGTAGCTACHDNPPANGSDGSNAWHSSYHANNLNVGAINPNACELCHNDPTVPYGTWVPVAFSSVGTDGKYHGYQINPAAIAQHANGTATVLAKFVYQCFGCH
jgi:hypothetical protein